MSTAMEPLIAMKWERKMMMMVVMTKNDDDAGDGQWWLVMVMMMNFKLAHRVVEGVYKMLGSDGEGRAEEIFTKMDK